MSLPYSKNVVVEAVSGQANCFVIPAPTRGIITRLTVKQTTGDTDGFDYELYDRHDACSAVSEQSFNPGDAELGDPMVHRIIPRQSVSAGNVLDEHFETVWSYENRAEREVTSKRRRQAVYLEITPGGSTGSKLFEVAYTINQPELT